eukprot:29366-Pelagomonas_calceolata.AAC.2
MAVKEHHPITKKCWWAPRHPSVLASASAKITQHARAHTKILCKLSHAALSNHTTSIGMHLLDTIFGDVTVPIFFTKKTCILASSRLSKANNRANSISCVQRSVPGPALKLASLFACMPASQAACLCKFVAATREGKPLMALDEEAYEDHVKHTSQHA